MGHGHHHPHDHRHDHSHGTPSAEGPLPPALDVDVPDSELSPSQLSRRSMLRRAGLLGAGLAGAGALGGTTPAAALPNDTNATNGPQGSDARTRGSGHGGSGNGFLWLAGDHHIHTQYSSDGKYRVIDQVRQGARHGLDWMVITDHGSATHARIGVDKVNPDIKDARAAHRDQLVFQGLEWNIPGAEHATVFVHPGRDEVEVLKRFETDYDGSLHPSPSPSVNEALAVSGLRFLAEQVRRRKVDDALMLANHPARQGIDSPHEIRDWRDATSAAHPIAVGMEGAPGHQAAGLPSPKGPGGARGLYGNGPGANSFPGYPAESYRTWGGFDWMTATVGGLWDSLLAEGKPWWITANSDSHQVYAEPSVRGQDDDFAGHGKHADPVYGSGLDLTQNDYWPGHYSRTHVGAARFSYAAVMDGMRAGRIWVDHGGLISGLDARLKGGGRWATLGGALHVKRGTDVELSIEIALANGPNWAQFVPTLARVDVIRGQVTGPVADRDTFTAPTAKVATSFEVGKSTGTVRLTYRLGRIAEPQYVRLRGTDGKRTAVGLRGAAVDPAGPAGDVRGDADPWQDLWFYSNPIWVLPA
ncbi:PHP domain-containing protein [Streptomyces sp. NRRL F-5135]|uniref:PHP domain-containing protein n=1 Tax=Streptomyces sp. NRRL F-5135 TaxID=1463858 RepID=UPI0004C809AE|nr:PHP domain-containing protein [Streptomyces sp. NRRL F-5135]